MRWRDPGDPSPSNERRTLHLRRVNPDARRKRRQSRAGASLDGTVGPYQVYAAPSAVQRAHAPHYPGVFPGPSHEPVRTAFGECGVPGAGLERDVTDLDLTKNRHPAFH